MKTINLFFKLFPELAGNRLQVILLLIICISCKSKVPLNALIYGLSGDGKSHLVKAVFKLIPPEWIIYLSSMTYAALTRVPPDYLKHKILYLAETHAKDENVLYFLRLIKSEGRFERMITGKDGESELLIIDGPVCSIATTSSDLSKFKEDDKNRDIIFPVESGEEQKKKIFKLNAEEAQGKKSSDSNELQKKFQQYLRLYPRMNVRIPYADVIYPEIYSNRAPRIQKQMYEIIRIIAMLNYPYKEEAFHSPQELTIDATLEDYEFAYPLFHLAFESQLTAKSSLILHYRHIKDGLERNNLTVFTRVNVQDWTSLKATAAKNKLKELLDHGLISIHTPHRSNQPAKYILNQNAEINESPFVHPDELWSLVVNRRRDQQTSNNNNILECGHSDRKGETK